MKRDNFKVFDASPKCIKSELEIVMDDQSSRFTPNSRCCSLLAAMMPVWLPAHLYFQMADGLRGYCPGVAQLMVEHLIKFVSGAGRHLTGIDSVDVQLMALYEELYSYAQEHHHQFEPVM